jgi:hypothetical protein
MKQNNSYALSHTHFTGIPGAVLLPDVGNRSGLTLLEI